MTGGEYYRQIVAEVRGRENYFKATQPDGLSFMGDPKTHYVVGETAEAEGGGSVLCKAGLLHVSDVPSETLAGGKWPARLFEVRGEIIVGFTPEHPHKGGAKRLEVLRELPAWLALGPNGRIVAEFIASLPSLDARAWCAALDAARSAARNAVLDAAWNAVLNAARGAARNAARGAARNAVLNAARGAAWNAVLDAAWNAARGAARNAVLALVVADLITAAQLAMLYAPFERVLPLAELRKRAIAAHPLTVLP